jgi:hypothetical protein
MASRLRKEFHLFEDYPDDSSYIDFVEKRHGMLFRLGDRVRIAHGIFMLMHEHSLETPMDANSDPTIGAFGTIVSTEVNGEDSKHYNEEDHPILSVQFEQEWDPRLKNRFVGLADVMHKIQAGDVINYTLLGEEEGNKLFEITKDRNLLFYESLTSSVIPYDYQNYAIHFCDDDFSSENFLEMKESELQRHSTIVYTEMYKELIKVNRRFRWLVTYRKMNES